MRNINFTKVDRILAKVYRDLGETDDLNESDVIEWIGEALEFMRVPKSNTQAVSFVKVTDHHADMPCGLEVILQIARHNNWEEENCECPVCPNPEQETDTLDCEEETEPNSSSVLTACDIMRAEDYPNSYKPYFDMQWDFIPWTSNSIYRENYTPVRLSNNVFFNSLVCKEKNEGLYHSCEDEYTIVGDYDRKLRFSFKEGFVAISYVKMPIDSETGYPLIPDHPSYMAAITYYIKWRLASKYAWSGREGFVGLQQDSQKNWLRYAKQAKNALKMPDSIDELQNLLEETHQMIPNHRRYYGFFGNLGREESSKFKDPRHRNRYRYYNR